VQRRSLWRFRFAPPEERITVAQCRSLSLRLTGAGLSNLHPTAAANLLDVFMSMGRGADLADFITSGALANNIVAAFHPRLGGVSNVRDGQSNTDNCCAEPSCR